MATVLVKQSLANKKGRGLTFKRLYLLIYKGCFKKYKPTRKNGTQRNRKTDREYEILVTNSKIQMPMNI